MAFKIFRKVREMLDVNADDITDGQVLAWDDATSKFIPADGGGAGGAPTDATYITQTASANLDAEQALGDLATGIVKNTTTTGVLSIAAEGTDYYKPSGTDVAVADGGTGASTAAGARTNLGLVIGTDVQAYDADLTTWAGLTPSAFFQTLVDDANAATGRGTLGAAPATAKYITQTADSELSAEQALGALATGILKNTTTTGVLSIATEGTDYTKPGGTDVALADGGTGTSLSDPNADRIMFWDDSAGNVDWLTAGTGLSISGTTITASGGSTVSYAKLSDEKTAGTDAGTFTSGSWQTRTLNTEIDADSIVSLSSNQFTPVSGTYEIFVRAPAFHIDNHQARLRNVTDGTTTMVGSSESCNKTSDFSTSNSFIFGTFTTDGSKAFEVQHRCQTTFASQGLGHSVNFDEVEVYTTVLLKKIG